MLHYNNEILRHEPTEFHAQIAYSLDGRLAHLATLPSGWVWSDTRETVPPEERLFASQARAEQERGYICATAEMIEAANA